VGCEAAASSAAWKIGVKGQGGQKGVRKLDFVDNHPTLQLPPAPFTPSLVDSFLLEQI
jgi:hypothetical protein